MATITYKVGDVVRLKHSTLPMTIESVQARGVAVCVWFDDYGKLQRVGFRLETLEPADAVIEVIDPKPKRGILESITLGLPNIIAGSPTYRDRRREWEDRRRQRQVRQMQWGRRGRG